MSKPRIRFNGYVDDWEQRKVEDVMSCITDYVAAGSFADIRENVTYLNENGYAQLVRTVDLKKKFTNDDFVFVDESAFKYLWRVNLNEACIVLPNIGANIGEVYYVEPSELPERNNVLGPNAILLRTNEDKYFVFTLLSSDIFQKQLFENVGSSGQPKFNKTELKSIAVSIPDINEQEKIGEYFQNLDHLITLHQRKYEQAKTQKKYMLQKMFPKNGTNVPEIRFDGFTDAWEQRKLGEITELKSASRVHKGEWTTEGVPFYRSSDVMAAINGTENDKAFISEELYEKLSSVSGKLEEGDILVTGGGSVGNPYIVPNNDPLYTKDADLLWIKNQGKFNPYFVYEFFMAPSFRSYLGSISHVGTIAHYTITQLSETPISLPSVEEQDKLGEYFRCLDHLITLHQRKVENLKSLKKACLEKMFV